MKGCYYTYFFHECSKIIILNVQLVPLIYANNKFMHNKSDLVYITLVFPIIMLYRIILRITVLLNNFWLRGVSHFSSVNEQQEISEFNDKIFSKIYFAISQSLAESCFCFEHFTLYCV